MQKMTSGSSGSNWKLLGEIELPAEPGVSQIQAWLVETLRPLNLSARIMENILASARLPEGGVIPPGDVDSVEMIHVQVFIPHMSPRNGQTWGFFRIEKKGEQPLSSCAPGHSVLFYLYLEGK